MVYGRIYKIYIILKTDEYFLTKIEQYMSKSHMY